jgi:hypothetical protein
MQYSLLLFHKSPHRTIGTENQTQLGITRDIEGRKERLIEQGHVSAIEIDFRRLSEGNNLFSGTILI